MVKRKPQKGWAMRVGRLGSRAGRSLIAAVLVRKLPMPDNLKEEMLTDGSELDEVSEESLYKT